MLLRRLYPPGPEGGRHIVKYYVRVPIGASGAAGTHVGKGITVAKSATGRYTATVAGVSGSVGAILYASCSIVSTTPQDSTVRAIDDTTGVVTFSTHAQSAPGTEAEPEQGAILLVCIAVRNSSSDAS